MSRLAVYLKIRICHLIVFGKVQGPTSTCDLHDEYFKFFLNIPISLKINNSTWIIYYNVAQLVRCRTRNHWFNSRPGHFGLSLRKTFYSILPQSTQLKNRYLAFISQCLELVHYMLPAALEYPLGD